MNDGPYHERTEAFIETPVEQTVLAGMVVELSAQMLPRFAKHSTVIENVWSLSTTRSPTTAGYPTVPIPPADADATGYPAGVVSRCSILLQSLAIVREWISGLG